MKRLLSLLGLGLFSSLSLADGRLLATGGTSSLEGAAGGGITPWAVLAGYGERGEWGADVFATRVETGDYRLDVAGIAASFDNRIELSYGRQRFDLGTLARNLQAGDTGDAARTYWSPDFGGAERQAEVSRVAGGDGIHGEATGFGGGAGKVGGIVKRHRLNP